MRYVFSGLLFPFALALALSGPVAALTPGGNSGRLVELEVPAPSLAGNLIGTADVQAAAVYLPPSYDSDPQRRYPVVYLLHGIFDDHAVWDRFFEIPARLDRVFAAGDVPEFLLVMPDGGNHYGGGYYRNSPVSGNWADYIAEDLVGYIDANFRTLPDKDSRAIVGHSMGGYGALHLAMTRPGLVTAIWAMSPCCLAVDGELSLGNDAWKRASAVASLDDLHRLFDQRDYMPVAALGLITAFGSEAGTAPIHASFPFEIVRGEVVRDSQAYDRYVDAFPLARVDEARDALRALRGLALGVGLSDQFQHIPPATLAFSQALGQERIPHRLDVFDGDHREHVGARLEDVVLPWIAGHLTAAD